MRSWVSSRSRIADAGADASPRLPDGILFIDRISRLKRSLYVKKRKKQLAAGD